MSLSAIVVDAVVMSDMMSVLHSRSDWLICLFAVRKFRKIDLNPKKDLLFCSAIFEFCVANTVHIILT